MEQLINSVLTKGSGLKSNLVIKVFGGGKISAALRDVGAVNAAFVRDFLINEGYTIAGEDLGGNYARKVMFVPSTGKAFIKRLDSMAGEEIAREEMSIATKKPEPAPVDDIELF